MSDLRQETIKEAIQAVGLSAWKHAGEDDYSRGMDAGACQQLWECLKAVSALLPAEEAKATEPPRDRRDIIERLVNASQQHPLDAPMGLFIEAAASIKSLREALSILAGPPENGEHETAVENDSPVTIRCELGDLRRAWAALPPTDPA